MAGAPLAAVVPGPGCRETLTKEMITAYRDHVLPKWWLADDVVFLMQYPRPA
jgi:hypothetical protein